MSHKSVGIKAETGLRTILQARGYVVIRSAASKSLDLVIVRPKPYPSMGLEVKSNGTGRIDLRKNSKEQWEELCKMEQDGYKVYYAICWRKAALGGDLYELFRPSAGPIYYMGTGIHLDTLLCSRTTELARSPQYTPYSPPRTEHSDKVIEDCAEAMRDYPIGPEYQTAGGGTD